MRLGVSALASRIILPAYFRFNTNWQEDRLAILKRKFERVDAKIKKLQKKINDPKQRDFEKEKLWKTELEHLTQKSFSLTRDMANNDLNPLREYKAKFIANPDNHAHQVKVTTADHVEIDTLMIQHPRQIDLPPEQQKWILFANPNASSYEELIDFYKSFSDATEANIYMGNYRGIMDSQGVPRSTHDLVLDVEAMVQKLLSSGVPAENILLHGWSLGGGVVTEVAALHQEVGHEMHLCNDRSFASLIHVTQSFSPILGGLLGRIAWLAGWRFNSVDNFNKIKDGHKFTIFGKGDQVISYNASLHKAVIAEDKGSKYKNFYEFEIMGENTHCISLVNQTPELFKVYTDKIKKLFWGVS